VKKLNFVMSTVEKAVKQPSAGQLSSVWQLLSFVAINIALVRMDGCSTRGVLHSGSKV
jgi:hypothetical protein